MKAKNLKKIWGQNNFGNKKQFYFIWCWLNKFEIKWKISSTFCGLILAMLLKCAKFKFHSWIVTWHNLHKTNLCAVWSNKKTGQAGWHISRRISKASCSTGYPRKQDKKDFAKDKKQTKIPSRMIWLKFF